MLLEEFQIMLAHLSEDFQNWSTIKKAGMLFVTAVGIQGYSELLLSEEEEQSLNVTRTKCEELLTEYLPLFNEQEVQNFIKGHIGSVVSEAPDYDKDFALQSLLDYYKELTGVELDYSDAL